MHFIIGCGGMICAVLLVLWPETAFYAAKDALTLSAEVLIPSLFPFFVCANTVVESGLAEKAGRKLKGSMKALFGIDGGGAAAVLLGFIGGYPTGAVTVCRLYRAGIVSRRDAEKLLAFTNNPGPFFMIGTIGMGMFGDKRIGYILCGSIWLSAFLTGVLLRKAGKAEEGAVKRINKESSADPMRASVDAILSLCGFVVFFSVILAFLKNAGVIGILSGALTRFGIDGRTADFLSMGIWEISTAAKESESPAYWATAWILAAGGISVFLQSAAVIRKSGLPVRLYIFGKLLAGTLAGISAEILFRVFPAEIPAYAPAESLRHIWGGGLWLPVLFSILLYGIIRILAGMPAKKRRKS